MRPSIGRPSVGRQSSVGVGRLSTGTNYNRWSVASSSVRRPSMAPNKKSTKEEDICGLMRFFDDQGVQFNYSERSLKNPQLNDFRTWLEFIVKCIDPNYKAEKEIEKTMPALFSVLHYPYVIKPSMCMTVNSPHNWPFFLKALHWLTKVATRPQKAYRNEEDDNAYVVSYVIHCCNLPEGEDIQPTYEIFKELIVESESQTEEEKEVEELRQKMVDLKYSIELEEKAVCSNEAEKATQMKKKENMEREVEEKKEKMNALVVEKENIIAEHNNLTEKVETHCQEIDELKNKIKAQPMTADEARALLKRRTQLRQDIHDKKSEAEKLRKAHTDTQSNYQKTNHTKLGQFKKFASDLASMAREVGVQAELVDQLETALFGKAKDVLNTEGMSGAVAQSFQTMIRSINKGIKAKIETLGLGSLEEKIMGQRNQNEDLQVKIKMTREGYEMDLENDRTRTKEFERAVQESRDIYESIKNECGIVNEKSIELERACKTEERTKSQLVAEQATAISTMKNIDMLAKDFYTEVYSEVVRINEEIQKLCQIEGKLEQKAKFRIDELKTVTNNIKKIQKAHRVLLETKPNENVNFLP
ncbi:unnamed protein product [Bursaphelenchus okinawaensis]|uniref:Kinetochore protein NDC80 n=1 Tax=Bursaphelenchus okinawaensis TaxID=465554 RepID=A0A811LAJ4_9BILA|nr:unnamed protein product [Bursaphelenchus okinawaensis]CAG9120805.1 unnamed protein product [Bursaphelenchus okinawaensis]